MASSFSGLLFKEIEDSKDKEKDKDDKGANLSWRQNSAETPDDGQHQWTRTFQNESRQSNWLTGNSPSPLDNRSGRGSFRPRGNLDVGLLGRNQHHSFRSTQSEQLKSKPDGVSGTSSDALQWWKRETESHPKKYEGIPGFQACDNRRGRGSFRPRGNLGVGLLDRNQRGSFWRSQSDQLNLNTDAFSGISSDAQQEIVSHPEDEGIPGFQVAEMKEKLTMDSSELLMHLKARTRDFATLLKRKLGPSMIMLVVEILAKITTSSKKEMLAALLAHSIQPSVLEQFSSFSFDIIAQNMALNTEELIKYFENLYVLYNNFVQMMPAKASDILSDHCTRAVMALQNLKLMRKLSVAPKLEEDYRVLMDLVESLIEERKSASHKRYREKVKREWQPGIDFRELSVVPLPQDLSSKMEVNLCPAVIDGPYKSVEHYLDVQFNLMREDFLIPLREGIITFIHQQSSESSKYKRIENVRFYRGVRFLKQYVEGETLVTEVLFNPRAKSSRHNWSRSKRLLFGTLLCFTSDLFSSIILGLVVDREVKLLEQGILHCELLGDVKEEGLFKKEFIMAESEVYFEAYQHVLKALQNFNDDNFPLKEYLIDVSSDLHHPTYLNRNPNIIYKWERKEFHVLKEKSWPTKEEMELNESQYKALHSALTKKCAVIQGPPGTGKTYLGLKIAKILLENAVQWRNRRRGPILVVCFTNHALDQFLEGILSITSNIVRIGSQSKNEKLNEYNLRVVRKTKGIRGFGLADILIDIEECTSSIKLYNGRIKECMNNAGIISLRYLSRVIGRSAPSFAFSYWNDSTFVEWLFAGSYFQNLIGSDLDLNDTEPLPLDDFYSRTLYDIKSIISELEFEASKAEGYEKEVLRNEIMMWVSRFQYMKRKLSEPFEPNMDLIQRLMRVRNINSLQSHHRWTLYRYWVSELIEYYQEELMRTRRYFQNLNHRKSKIMQEMYLNTILESCVVGLTTTGAARHQDLLQQVGPKIVIVEEAAEAMESHVVACLSSKCEHLILIGDHKQLHPSTAVYRLAKDYHLEISLFERMLLNGIRFDTLRIQHRMRPDIADLVFPAVYPVLENHPSVLAHDDIAGLKKNLFFITHMHPEEAAMDDLSKRNAHEAEFLIALCRHIILQGYDPSQITILTSYLGQMFLLNEERDKYHSIKNVRIAVVDNFQGEENDIILLSLVRNNMEGKIGFLASENRTCVALSRAKKGLYIMGNIDMLADKSSLWSKIRKVLQEKEAVGTHLTLQCLKHPEQLTEVSKAEDFNHISGGGCRLMCNEKLDCGHICKKVCHIEGHEHYKCQEICNRVMCCRDHRCEKQCWVECGECKVPVESTLPCGHETVLPCCVDPREYRCLEVLTVKLPDCGHTIKKLCRTDINEADCTFPCDSRLPCGHVCAYKCHVKRDPDHLEYKCLRPCARKNANCQDEHMCEMKCFEKCGLCKVKVKRKLPNCEHYFDMDCSMDPLTFQCFKPCKKQLDCGHECQRKCVEPCGGCLKIVEKEIPDCKHKAKVKCSEVPESRMCRAKCERILTCGHNCTSLCGIPCEDKSCESLSMRTIRARCGHEVRLYCNEISKDPSPDVLMLRCKELCVKILVCGHRCKGTCAQCMQGRIHITCPEKCERKLICGHKCTAPCSKPCPPCKEQCYFRCEHSRCKSKCGYCSPCKKKCGWNCEHQTCKQNCYDFCDRPPCNEPCKEKLDCGHECIGFCGEKCPNLCRVCNPQEVEDALVALNATDDKNSRFVLLPDCGHVFEWTSLEKSLCMTAHVVKLLECPKCHVPIQQAYRYRNAAKNHWNRVMQVKHMVTGNPWQVSRKVEKLAEKLWDELKQVKDFQTSYIDGLKQFIRRNKKSHFGAAILYSLEARMGFALSVTKHYSCFHHRYFADEANQICIEAANSLIQKLLGRLDNITPQEHSDYEGECMRFHIMMKLHAVERRIKGKATTVGNWNLECKQIYEVVEKPDAFFKVKYMEMLRKIDDLVRLNNIQLLLFSMERPLTPRDVAFDLHEGRWYECPNGHIFAIGERGQGIQTTNCDQCNVEIMEGTHQLFSMHDL